MSPRERSPFRIVFWGLLVLVLFLVLIPPLLRPFSQIWIGHGHWPGGFPSIAITPMLTLMPLVLVFGLYAIVAGSLVHRDASRRGMDPWLWTSIAVFVPAFIGVVIYLVVRTSSGHSCLNCGRAIEGDFRHCPYCGHSAGSHCSKCNRAIEAEWKVCPNCGHHLQVVDQPPEAGEA